MAVTVCTLSNVISFSWTPRKCQLAWENEWANLSDKFGNSKIKKSNARARSCQMAKKRSNESTGVRFGGGCDYIPSISHADVMLPCREDIVWEAEETPIALSFSLFTYICIGLILGKVSTSWSADSVFVLKHCELSGEETCCRTEWLVCKQWRHRNDETIRQ